MERVPMQPDRLIELLRQHDGPLFCGHAPVTEWPAVRQALEQAKAEFAAFMGAGGLDVALVTTAKAPGAVLADPWLSDLAADFAASMGMVCGHPILSDGWARLTSVPESKVDPHE